MPVNGMQMMDISLAGSNKTIPSNAKDWNHEKRIEAEKKGLTLRKEQNTKGENKQE